MVQNFHKIENIAPKGYNIYLLQKLEFKSRKRQDQYFKKQNAGEKRKFEKDL